MYKVYESEAQGLLIQSHVFFEPIKNPWSLRLALFKDPVFAPAGTLRSPAVWGADGFGLPHLEGGTRWQGPRWPPAHFRGPPAPVEELE